MAETTTAADEGYAKRPFSLTDTAEATIAEFFKSYGVKRDEHTGEWSWSLGNIGEAFKENPIFTTLDYATLLLGPARFGMALGAVAKGSGALGKAYKVFKAGAGAVEDLEVAEKLYKGKSATTYLGKAAQMFGAAPELAAGAEMRVASGVNRFHGFKIPGFERTFSVANPITTHVSDELKMAGDRFGYEVWEGKAVASTFERERLISDSTFGAETQKIAKLWRSSGLSKEEGERAVGLLRERVEPKDLEGFVAQHFGENKIAAEAYKAQWTFRNMIHEESYRLGLIDKATYEANLYKYDHVAYEEIERARDAMREMAPGTRRLPGKFEADPEVRAAERAAAQAEGKNWKPSTRTTMKGDRESMYQAKTGRDMSHLTEVLDPIKSVGYLARAGQQISQQRYVQGIAGSVLTGDGHQMVDKMASLLEGYAPGATEAMRKASQAQAAMLGLSERQVGQASQLFQDITATNRHIIGDEFAKVMGWQKIDSLYKGSQMPAYLKNLPENLRNRWMDPSVAEEVMGTFKVMDDPNMMREWYGKMLRVFMASKTAYNPPAFIRNFVGASIFSHLSTGDIRSFIPLKGIKAFFGHDPENAERLVKAGVFGSTYSKELLGEMGKNIDYSARSALEWLPSNKFFNLIKKGAAKMEEGYRAIDEIYKADTWIRSVGKYEKTLGKGSAEALNQATLNLNKFTPSFLQRSPVADALRGKIPFASFTAESFRVWKNVMAEKPHMAFFYNHVAQSMSQTFGMMAGMSPEDVEEAKAGLPSYLEGKKTLLLPFRVEGKPQFVDLSYMIPLGSIQSAADSERFFLTGVLDPGANPVISGAAAMLTGKDPFTGREIAPDFTERQLGIPVTGPRTRKALGLAEHMMRVMLPPWTPPGFSGVNILESIRGQKDPRTGGDLEAGVFRTVLSNMAGLKAYEPNAKYMVRNVQEDDRRIGEETKQAWDRWEFAKANGDVHGMETERERIVAIKTRQGVDDPRGYYADGVGSRAALFNNLSTSQLQRILDRAQKLGTLSDEDKKIRTELLARYQKRTKNKSAAKAPTLKRQQKIEAAFAD